MAERKGFDAGSEPLSQVSRGDLKAVLLHLQPPHTREDMKEKEIGEIVSLCPLDDDDDENDDAIHICSYV